MRVHSCLKRSKTVLCCRLIFLSCGMDAHEGGVRGYSSKQVSFEQPGMHALQPALHVCSPVTVCQILHCHIILQSKQCHFWMQDTPNVVSGRVRVHAMPGCMCFVSSWGACRHQSRHSITDAFQFTQFCVQLFTHAFKPSCIHLFSHSFVHSVVQSFVHAFIRSSID